MQKENIDEDYVLPNGSDDGIYRYQSFGCAIMDSEAILKAEF